MASKFRNAGQTCICANRIYVQRGSTTRFSIDYRTNLRADGRPRHEAGVDIGPLIDVAALDKVQQHVDDAIARGAEVTTGGKRLSDGDLRNGQFFAPTVLDRITPDMRMWSEETFGPVAGLTRFDNEDDVIRLANATPYGLAAYSANARLPADLPRRRASGLRRHRRQRRCTVECGRAVWRIEGIRIRAVKAEPTGLMNTST